MHAIGAIKNLHAYHLYAPANIHMQKWAKHFNLDTCWYTLVPGHVAWITILSRAQKVASFRAGWTCPFRNLTTAQKKHVPGPSFGKYGPAGSWTIRRFQFPARRWMNPFHLYSLHRQSQLMNLKPLVRILLKSLDTFSTIHGSQHCLLCLLTNVCTNPMLDAMFYFSR